MDDTSITPAERRRLARLASRGGAPEKGRQER
jgi:hypothetical protein